MLFTWGWIYLLLRTGKIHFIFIMFRHVKTQKWKISRQFTPVIFFAVTQRLTTTILRNSTSQRLSLMLFDIQKRKSIFLEPETTAEMTNTISAQRRDFSTWQHNPALSSSAMTHISLSVPCRGGVQNDALAWKILFEGTCWRLADGEGEEDELLPWHSQIFFVFIVLFLVCLFVWTVECIAA